MEIADYRQNVVQEGRLAAPEETRENCHWYFVVVSHGSHLVMGGCGGVLAAVAVGRSSSDDDFQVSETLKYDDLTMFFLWVFPYLEGSLKTPKT